MFSIDRNDYGGTKISTVDPHTVLQTSIYKAVMGAFTKALSGVPRATSVEPFSLCFGSKNISSTHVGPAVPQVDLVQQSRSVVWKILGANLMVQAYEGVNPTTSIVIGGHQLENNLIQVDLAALRLGFNSSLLSRQTTYSNFNFTSES